MKYNKITISGKICTGKTTLFGNLKEKLDWPTFSASHFFRQYAQKHRVSLQKAEEQKQDLTKRIDLKTQKLLEEKDKIIVEGWMAGIMADKIAKTLRILLVCNDEKRLKRLSKRDGLTIDQAKQKIIEREENLIKKLTEIYHRNDFFDPQNYNLVIDTTSNSPKQILDIVLQTLEY